MATSYNAQGPTPGILSSVTNLLKNPVGLNPVANIGQAIGSAVGGAVQNGANAIGGFLSPAPKVVAPVTESPSSYPNGLLPKANTQSVQATPSPVMQGQAYARATNQMPLQSTSTGYPGIISNPSPTSPIQPSTPIQTSTPTVPTPNAFSSNVTNLTNIGSGQENPQVTKAREDLKNFQTQYAQQTGANSAAPIPLEFSQGRNQVLANQYNAALPAYQGAVTNSITSQGQQIGAAEQAGSLSQPVGQFGLLTNPQTGQPLNTGVFQSAIQQAQQLVNNNVPVNDPSVQALLSPFGFVGPLAFNQAMQSSQNSQGGTWNPAAQSAATSQNITQGVGSQQQAYNLNLGLQQLKTIQPVIQNFLQTSGINPTDLPVMNTQIGTYIANLKNPAATVQYQYMINDLQKFASQMLQAGAGGTPTGTQAATDLMNPQNLSMNQIQYALNTLDALGSNQVGVLQQQSQASLGGQQGQYAGNPATVSSSVPIAPNNAGSPQNESPLSEAGKGTLLGAASWGLNQAQNLGGELLSFIGGLYAGGK